MYLGDETNTGTNIPISGWEEANEAHKTLLKQSGVKIEWDDSNEGYSVALLTDNGCEFIIYDINPRKLLELAIEISSNPILVKHYLKEEQSAFYLEFDDGKEIEKNGVGILRIEQGIISIP